MQHNVKRLCVLLCGVVLASMLLVVVNAIAVEPPETARIVFMSDRKGKKNKDIFAIDPDGQNVQRITKHGKQDISPSWSRDGTRILFASDRESHFERVYIMDNDGENIRVVTAGNRDLTPSWSPNENWLAVVHAHGADNWNFDVWVVRIVEDRKKNIDPFPFADLGDGDQETSFRLTFHSAQDESPSWSPDGKRIAWSSNRTGNYDIFVMDRTGDNKKNLTNTPRNEKKPGWQPPLGLKIVFASDRDGDSEIFVMDRDGGNVRQLTKNIFVWDGHPTWSPNGKEIAFATNRARNNEIFIMDANGNNLTNVTNDPGSDTYPSWFDPKIAFSVSSKAKRTVTWGEIKQSGRKLPANR